MVGHQLVDHIAAAVITTGRTSRRRAGDAARPLNTLLQARLDAERHDTRIHLARPTDIVTRVLEITGADQVFPVDREVPAAVPHTDAG